MEHEYSEEEYQDDFTKYENDDFNEQKQVEYLWARLHRPKTKSYLSICVGSLPIQGDPTSWIDEAWPDWNITETFIENRAI